jgi:hypothetical protein
LLPINSGQRRAEWKFGSSFNQLQLRILGGLLNVITGAFRELPLIQIADLPRVADFIRFGDAVGRAMGCPSNTLLFAYFSNRKDASNSSLEDSIVADVVLD